MKMKTKEDLNVRKGPSVKYPVVTVIPKGTVVEVGAVKDGWGAVTYKGVSGYSSMAYLEVVPTPKPNPTPPPKPTPTPSPSFVRPTLGEITSEFGMRNLNGQRGMHPGVDIANKGDVGIFASEDGIVIKSYLSKTYGECIIIRHIFGNQIFETLYAHMKSGSRKVQIGDKVKQGQQIGIMGNTGASFGEHLHFELHKPTWNIEKSNAVNPRNYIKF